MKITAVEAVPYALPFTEPYVTARGRLERREMVLVRVRTDDGPVGLGEAVAMSLRGGTEAASLASEIRRHGEPGLVGLEVDTDRAPSAPPAVRSMSPAAIAALEIGLMDLAAKAADQPQCRSLCSETV